MLPKWAKVLQLGINIATLIGLIWLVWRFDLLSLSIFLLLIYTITQLINIMHRINQIEVIIAGLLTRENINGQ